MKYLIYVKEKKGFGTNAKICISLNKKTTGDLKIFTFFDDIK